MNQLIELINESKRTGCKKPANHTFVVLFHYAIGNPDYLILLESDNIHWKNDLLIVNHGKHGACLPVPLLNEDARRFTYRSIGKKKQRDNAAIKVVKRKVHNRVIKPRLPGQEAYLFGKLEQLQPNWRDISERYLCQMR